MDDNYSAEKVAFDQVYVNNIVPFLRDLHDNIAGMDDVGVVTDGIAKIVAAAVEKERVKVEELRNSAQALADEVKNLRAVLAKLTPNSAQ